MDLASALKAIMVALGVFFSDTCIASYASAQIAPLPGVSTVNIRSSSKTYAVFMAAYNRNTGEARGGIAGTAFFVSKKKAITAFHVLQAKSFTPPNGFTDVQVWLVHEGEEPIELELKNLKSRADQDVTVVELGSGLNVPEKFIFEVAAESGTSGPVHTEGFLANSTGPVLHAKADGRLAVVAVPKLARLQSSGAILQAREINLDAADMRLRKSSCLQLSYKPVVGLSGGPVIMNGKVVAMNSFADPTSRAQTWAVDLLAQSFDL